MKPDRYDIFKVLAFALCSHCESNPGNPQRPTGASCADCPAQKAMEAQR